MCPMIVAGPQKATVSGTFFGQHVESDFSRAGCEGMRWAKLGAVFGAAGPRRRLRLAGALTWAALMSKH